jgi:hypothetical protein
MASPGWCGGSRGSSVKQATVPADGETITVHIPLKFRRRGGRKMIVTPDGATWAPRPRVDNAMVKALARAFRWRRMLDTGVYATLEDLAKAKRLAPSYVSGVLCPTPLAPEIVEAILDRRQPPELRLEICWARFRWSGRQPQAVARRHRGAVAQWRLDPPSRSWSGGHPMPARGASCGSPCDRGDGDLDPSTARVE